jgi:FkbM family methyltransferase
MMMSDLVRRSRAAGTLKRKDRFRLLLPAWIKRMVRSALVNPVVGMLVAAAFRNAIPHRGSRIATDDPAISPADKAALFFGLYERSEIDQVCAYLLPDVDVIELGASIGANTVEIAKRIDGSVRLFAVEPHPRNVATLNRTLALNGCRDRVLIVPAAIDYSGRQQASFTTSSVSNLRGRIGHPPIENAAVVQVAVVTLSGLLSQQNITRYQLVCDIEGAEVGILSYDADALRACVQILIEIDGGYDGDRWFSVADVAERIEACGFARVHQHANRMVFQRIGAGR